MEDNVTKILDIPTERLQELLKKHRELEHARRRTEALRAEILSLLKEKEPENERTPKDQGKKTIIGILVDALRKAKGPMTKDELVQAVIDAKYPTKSKNLKAQIGVLLYGEKSHLFRRVGRGQFTLANDK